MLLPAPLAYAHARESTGRCIILVNHLCGASLRRSQDFFEGARRHDQTTVVARRVIAW